MQRRFAALMALALAGCAGGLPAPTAPNFETDGWSGQTRTYRCADGTRLAVAYLKPQRGVALAVVTLAGTQAVLRSLPAASGARYVDVDEQRGLRWHSKGNEGFLAVLAPDHTATEQMLHTGCVAQP
jgi:membrane-bound inhibitor of C-type lysozyme